MGRSKRIRRGPAGWRQLLSLQSSSGLSVPEFCRREGVNASLFRRWRSTLQGSTPDREVTTRTQRAVESPAPFIDLGDLRSGGARLEVRLDLGGGLVLSIARG
jgi:transposase-like protein